MAGTVSSILQRLAAQTGEETRVHQGAVGKGLKLTFQAGSPGFQVYTLPSNKTPKELKAGSCEPSNWARRGLPPAALSPRIQSQESKLRADSKRLLGVVCPLVGIS